MKYQDKALQIEKGKINQQNPDLNIPNPDLNEVKWTKLIMKYQIPLSCIPQQFITNQNEAFQIKTRH